MYRTLIILVNKRRRKTNNHQVYDKDEMVIRRLNTYALKVLNVRIAFKIWTEWTCETVISDLRTSVPSHQIISINVVEFSFQTTGLLHAFTGLELQSHQTFNFRLDLIGYEQPICQPKSLCDVFICVFCNNYVQGRSGFVIGLISEWISNKGTEKQIVISMVRMALEPLA